MPKVHAFTLPFGFSAHPCPACGLHVIGGQRALNVANVTVHADCWEKAGAQTA